MDAHLDDTYVHIRMCTLHALLVQYPALLTPSFHGSMARCLECSAPISRAIFRFVQSPVPFVPRSPVLSSHLHPVSTSSLLFYVLYNASPHLIRLFFPSFVRVTLAESSPAFRRLQCATAPLFSSPLSVPIRFLSLFRSRPHPRQDTRALLSFPRFCPFPFPIRRVSTVNRYFRSDAFRLSIVVSLFLSFLHVKWISTPFFFPSFFF